MVELFRGPEDEDEFFSPPNPLSERGPSPTGRPDDPACAGPTASRPQHCPRRWRFALTQAARRARKAVGGSRL